MNTLKQKMRLSYFKTDILLGGEIKVTKSLGKKTSAWEISQSMVFNKVESSAGGLLPEEEEIAEHIVAAWNKFIKLKQSHPDDKKDFHRGIHELQKVLGMRVLRRDYPDYWIDKGDIPI